MGCCNGKFIWSDQLYDIFDISPKKGEEINYEKWVGMLHPEDRDYVLNTISESLKTAEPFEFEHKIITASGKTKYLNGRGLCTKNLKGEVIQMSGTSLDITNRMSQSSRIQSLQKIIDAGDIGLCELTINGDIVNRNENTDCLLGSNSTKFAQLLPIDSRLSFKHNFIHSVNTFSTQVMQINLNSRVVELTIIPLVTNSLVSSVGVNIKDVTAIINAEIHQLESYKTGQEEEKKRIAAELHDSFGQIMAGLSLHLNVLKKKHPDINLSECENLIELATKEYRSIAHNLYPVELEKTSLPDAIESTLLKFNDNFKIKINKNIASNYEDKLINLEVKQGLFRMFQEASINAVKYSKAKTLELNLTFNRNIIEIHFKDDGVGFNTDNHISFEQKGLGLSNMKKRASVINCNMDIKSKLGNGTEIKFTQKLSPTKNKPN